jgi:mitochondrial import receptor subunit TOM40
MPALPAVSLKPELFEGCRFDFNKGVNQKFSLTHSVFMGSVEVPSQGPQTVKIPASSYEFGAILVDGPLLMVGKVLTDGRLTGRVKYDLSPETSVKLQTQLTREEGYSQGMVDVDTHGTDWQAQIKVGSGGFFGCNYIQSVTPQLSLGGEAFWLSQQRKSGVGFAARAAGEVGIFTAQVASTGLLSCTYAHKVSDKLTLASDFLLNWNSREASANCGYDYTLRSCRLRGRVDSNGGIAAYLEERLTMGVNLVLSAEVDHSKRDYRFGFGLTVGE